MHTRQCQNCQELNIEGASDHTKVHLALLGVTGGDGVGA